MYKYANKYYDNFGTSEEFLLIIAIPAIHDIHCCAILNTNKWPTVVIIFLK